MSVNYRLKEQQGQQDRQSEIKRVRTRVSLTESAESAGKSQKYRKRQNDTGPPVMPFGHMSRKSKDNNNKGMCTDLRSVEKYELHPEPPWRRHMVGVSPLLVLSDRSNQT